MKSVRGEKAGFLTGRRSTELHSSNSMLPSWVGSALRSAGFFVAMWVCCSRSASAQTGTIAALKQNVVYLGASNPMRFAVPGKLCSRIFVSTDNGTIVRIGACDFDFHPARLGYAYVSLCELKRGDTVRISEHVFRVKSIPDGEARIMMTSGEVNWYSTKESFARGGIIGVLHDFDYEARIRVEAFILTYQSRNGRNTVFESNTGPQFTEEMRRHLRTMPAGDTILITGVKGRYSDSSLRPMNDIRFVVPD